MTKHAALCLALLALSACDASEPVPDDPIVGTWILSTVTGEEIATVSQSQTVLDPNGPITSTVRVAGDESATFDILSSLGQSNDRLVFSLLSFDPVGPSPVRPLVLGVTDETTYRRIELREQTGAQIAYYNDGDVGDQMTRVGPTYRFSSVPLATFGDRRATLSGEVTFFTRALTANQPSVLTAYDYSSGPNYRLMYQFEADGRLTVREGDGFLTFERIGTWTRTQDRIELRTPVERGAATQVLEYTVQVDGPTLTLITGPSQSGCTGVCLTSYEQYNGLLAGTLLGIGGAQTSRFTREGAASARTATVGPASPPPPALRERLLLGPAR